jgi:NitT/TauT family transport system permease protein
VSVTSTETELVLKPAVAAETGETPLPSRRRRSRRGVFWRVRDEIPRSLELPLVAVSLALPLLLWSAIYYSGAVGELILPSPVATAEAGYEMVASGILFTDAWSSVSRVAVGFGISLAVSVPLGLAMGTFRSVRALFEPAISLIRYAPATAFTLLLIFWLGVGEEPKVALVFVGTVFFNTLMTANVVWQVPSELIRVSQTLGAGSATVFRKVIFPYAVPGMIDTARINLAAAWNLIVVAELIAADSGLGVRIVRAQKFLNIDQIFVAIAVIGLLGIAADLTLRTLRNRVAPWSQE